FSKVPDPGVANRFCAAANGELSITKPKNPRTRPILSTAKPICAVTKRNLRLLNAFSMTAMPFLTVAKPGCARTNAFLIDFFRFHGCCADFMGCCGDFTANGGGICTRDDGLSLQ